MNKPFTSRQVIRFLQGVEYVSSTYDEEALFAVNSARVDSEGGVTRESELLAAAWLMQPLDGTTQMRLQKARLHTTHAHISQHEHSN